MADRTQSDDRTCEHHGGRPVWECEECHRWTDSNILGTRVPDTPIHRASMWLESLWFERRRDATPQPMDDERYARFIQECGLHNVTPAHIKEAAGYYGTNNAVVLTGGRVNMMVPSPTGEGYLDLTAIFASVWVDAFMHGVATAKGKVGMSNDEIDAVRGREGST